MFFRKKKTELSRKAATLALCVAFLFALSGCGHDDSTTMAALGSGNLKWDHFPVTLEADPSFYDHGSIEHDLRDAAKFWELHAGKHLFDLGTWKSGQAPYTGDPTNPTALLGNAIYFLSPWPLDPKIAGNTTVHSEGETIKNAVIFLNSATPLCSRNCMGPGDELRTSRRRLLAHEMGHFLGFAHVSDVNNIMYPEIQPGGTLDDRQIDQGLLDRLTTP